MKQDLQLTLANFWYQNVSRQTYCLLRIFTGAILCLRLMGVWGIYRLNDLSARFPNHRFNTQESYMLEAFRLPIPYFEWLPVPSLFYYRLIFEYGMFLLAILFTVGLFTRFVAPLLALVLLYWTLLSQFFFYHHMMTFLLVLLIMGFSNCWQFYSLDAYLLGNKIAKTDRTIFPIRQLQITISIIYLFSGIAKLNNGWFHGEVLGSMADIGAIKGLFAPTIFMIFSYQLVSHFTIFAECFLIFGLWFPRTRLFSIFLGVIFHLGIDATMGVATFSYQMLALYLVFLEPKANATKVLFPQTENWQVCSRVCRLFDWFQRFDYQFKNDYSKLEVILNNGERCLGVNAILQILLRLPITFLLVYPINLFLKICALLSKRIQPAV